MESLELLFLSFSVWLLWFVNGIGGLVFLLSWGVSVEGEFWEGEVFEGEICVFWEVCVGEVCVWEVCEGEVGEGDFCYGWRYLGSFFFCFFCFGDVVGSFESIEIKEWGCCCDEDLCCVLWVCCV